MRSYSATVLKEPRCCKACIYELVYMSRFIWAVLYEPFYYE